MAGTYGAAPRRRAGSDAALLPALAPGERVTHLCTNTAHMAQAGLPKLAARREGQEAVPKPGLAAGTLVPAPQLGRGKELAEVRPRRLLSQLRSKLILARLLVKQEKKSRK